MAPEHAIAAHYTRGDLFEAIQNSIVRLGKSQDTVTVDDLGPVDEFHIGGRVATKRLLDLLKFKQGDHILDVGCGLGGAARCLASEYNCHATGIDLTREYVDTGSELTAWVGLDRQVTLKQGSALDLPFDDEEFDGAVVIHVAMNIEDKATMFSELYRVLRPGTSLGVYDIMRIREGALTYPVPWAAVAETSRLSTPDQYRSAMTGAGFDVLSETNRGEFALEFFDQVTRKNRENGGPPPLGLHTLMGESTGTKLKNLVDNIAAGYVAPVEMIARR